MIPVISSKRASVVRAAFLPTIAVLAAALLISSCAGAPPVRELQPAQSADALVFHSGKRVDRDGVPFLTLSGSPYEVGLQYGVLLKPEIAIVYGEFDKLLDQLTGGGLRRFLFRLSLNGRIGEMRAAMPAGFEDELRGISDGAGVPFSDYLFFAMTPELLFDTACTSIVVRRGDQIMHGRNFDFPRPANFVSRYPAISRISVDGKVPYVNIGFAGLPGVYTGLNERGIAASVNTAAFTKNASHNVIPVGFLVKEILEDSASLHDVDSIMEHSTASHYFITVSSRDERTAAVYESLGETTTRVPMVTDTLCIANAPLSLANRQTNASILSQAEYNLARENELGFLTGGVPQTSSLAEYLAKVLGNHDFYSYCDFPAHQTLLQDSFKTINNFSTIQSVIIDWSQNLAIFSYRPSYAGFGPFLAYDLSSGNVKTWRPEDPFAQTEGFQEDNEFLDGVFQRARSRGMGMDREGWQQILRSMSEYPAMNAFLKADWTYSASMSLGGTDQAEQAALWIDQSFPDYYLGPLDRGLVAFETRNWLEAKTCFLVSESRPINSPATRLLAIAYASVASERLGDREQARRLRDQMREMLTGSWVSRDFDARLRSYIRDDEVESLIRGIAQESGNQ